MTTNLSFNKLFILVVATIVFSCPQSSYGQPAEVRLQQTFGCNDPDPINLLDRSNWWLGYMGFAIQARSSTLQSDVSIGFVVYSPDGSAPTATISDITLSPDWQSPTTYWSPSGAQLSLTDLDGALPDTWLVTATALPGDGFQSASFVDVLTFNLKLPKIDGAVVCIDSAFVAPAGQWLMTPDGPPTWQGGGGDANVGGTATEAFCITTYVGGLGAEYTNCVDSVTTSYCNPISYQVTAIHTDPPFFSVFYHTRHDGMGTSSVDPDGLVTYTPAFEDNNTVVTVTTYAQLPNSCDEGTTCQTKIAVTYDSPQAVSAPNVSMYVGATASLPAPSVIDADGCENYRWNLVGVSPIPNGSLTVDSVTGVITYTAVQADLALGSISVTTEVTDGINSSSCETIISFLCCLDPCCDAAGDADNSGQFNVADVTFLIARIFTGGIAPVCCGKADVDFSSSVNIADVTFMISRIFSGGPPPTCGPEGIICN